MITRDKVLELVKEKGPIIPSDLTAELKENTMIIGAFLSELISAKEIKISNAKIGGSPAYFIDTQKPELEKKLYSHLNEKNRRAFDVLKQNDILQDEPQTPLMRTALRAIPDFAVPFKVTYKGKQHLFWKYFLTSDDVVKTKVKAVLEQLYPTETKQEIKPEVKEEIKPAEVSSELKPIEVPTEKVEETKPEAKETPIETKPEAEDEKTKPVEKPRPEFEAQTTLKDSKETSEEKPQDEFLNHVEGYLNSLKIRIFSAKVIKKGKELDLKVHIPTPVGTMTYFCKARNKKKSNEGDIAQAFVEGQLLGLPTMYISNGDIPKKLEATLNHKYKNLKVLKL